MADTRKNFRFRVYSPPHTKFAAAHLVDQLRKLGHKADLTDRVNKFDSSIYILYNATSLSRFPKNYIVYQTEIHGTHYFNHRYLRIIKSAIAVWDYCPENLQCYTHRNISIVTPGVSHQPESKKDIEFLFYGWIDGSHRRKTMVRQLKQKIGLEVVTNKLCNEIWDILRRSKTVINIHYYDHSPLEIFRINEALSFGCDVVSEGYSERYEQNVTFTDYYGLAETALNYKKSQKKQNLTNLDNLLEIQSAIRKI